jgi:hypothetical protein
MYLYIFKKQLRWVNFTCNLYKQLMNKDITEMNRVGGVMVNIVEYGRSWSDQIKDYNIGICCLSAKHAALRSKDKYWLSQHQANVELSDMYSRGGVEWHVFPRRTAVVYGLHYSIQLSSYYKADIIIIESKSKFHDITK